MAAIPVTKYKNDTAIMPCSCVHSVQDEWYGPGMRVQNYARMRMGYRCTVCKALNK